MFGGERGNQDFATSPYREGRPVISTTYKKNFLVIIQHTPSTTIIKGQSGKNKHILSET